MLDRDDDTRITCQQVISHAWLRDENEKLLAHLPKPTTETDGHLNNETPTTSLTDAVVEGPIPGSSKDSDALQANNQSQPGVQITNK